MANIKQSNLKSNPLAFDDIQTGQMKVVYNAFKTTPASMLMVAMQTDIFRANICRYIARWRKAGTIKLVKKGFCKITKRSVGFYTTDKNLFTK